MIIGIGTDLFYIPRMEKMYLRVGDKAIKKLFTDQEIEFCNKRVKKFESFAKIFCAKESIIKAISDVKGMRWHDIEIFHNMDGKPIVELYGKATQIIKTKIPKNHMFKIDISITDEPPYAQSFAILWCFLK